jgi:beta-glucuronidase
VKVKDDDILLNGQSVWLRGICMHEDTPYKTTRTMTRKLAEDMLKTAKELGCNFIRLAHYPHTEHMARAADRLGIMLWEEIPLYWRPDFKAASVKAQSEDGLRRLVARDRNRASVIIWSVANETPPYGHGPRNKLVSALCRFTKKLDPTRLVSFATMGRGNPDDRMGYMCDDVAGKDADVIGWNEYLGWYSHLPPDIRKCTLDSRFNKPLIITETGGGAVKGLHGPRTRRWTEEFQAAIYAAQVKLWDRTAHCRGATPWILMDFRSPLRQNEFQQGYNRKGVVDIKLRKKKAFFVLQKYYLAKARTR